MKQDNSRFEEWFGNTLEDVTQGDESLQMKTREQLRSFIGPFVLRRTRVDVSSQIPSMHEHAIECPLTRRQKFLYGR